MDARTTGLGLFAAVTLLTGSSVLVAGQLWGLEETVTVEGDRRPLTESGQIDPGLRQLDPNRTLDVSYTVSNDRPMAWDGRVQLYADVLDGRREEVDHSFVDERVRLQSGQTRTFEVSTTARELGFTRARPDNWRGNAFTLVLEGPGPERYMVFRVAEEGEGSLKP